MCTDKCLHVHMNTHKYTHTHNTSTSIYTYTHMYTYIVIPCTYTPQIHKYTHTHTHTDISLLKAHLSCTFMAARHRLGQQFTCTDVPMRYHMQLIVVQFAMRSC